MLNGYRTATSADYAYVLRLLTDGDEQGVLVRSLYRCDVAPYPLLDISRGPYSLSVDGISGFSVEGEPYTIRITETDLHSVEMRRGDGEWMAPELGSVILLVPE